MDLPLKSLLAVASVDLPEAVALEDLPLSPELSFSFVLEEIETSDLDTPASEEGSSWEIDDKSYLLEETNPDHEILSEAVEVESIISLSYVPMPPVEVIKDSSGPKKLEIISISKTYPEFKASSFDNKLVLSSPEKEGSSSTSLVKSSISAPLEKTLETFQESVTSVLETDELLSIPLQEYETLGTPSTQIVNQNVNILNLDKDPEIKNLNAASLPEFLSDFDTENEAQSNEMLYKSSNLDAMSTQPAADSKIIQQTPSTLAMEITKPGSASIEMVAPRVSQLSPSIDLAPAVQQHLDYLEKNRPAMVCVQLKLDDSTSVEMTIKLTKTGKLQVNFPEESMPFKNDLIASWKPMQSTIQDRGWILDGPHFSGTVIQPSVAAGAVKILNPSEIARSIAVSSPISRQPGSKPLARVRFNSLRESLTTQIA